MFQHELFFVDTAKEKHIEGQVLFVSSYEIAFTIKRQRQLVYNEKQTSNFMSRTPMKGRTLELRGRRAERGNWGAAPSGPLKRLVSLLKVCATAINTRFRQYLEIPTAV